MKPQRKIVLQVIKLTGDYFLAVFKKFLIIDHLVNFILKTVTYFI